MTDLRLASRTAMMIASYRARAGDLDAPLFEDPWADALAGEAGHALSTRFDAAFPYMTLWLAVRTRFLDDAARGFVADGGRQVVLLGAGFDTRAARMAGADVVFFEVDHPATQAEKLRRVASLTGYPRDAARYVSCDFERQGFLERLREVGHFDADAPALFLWEGVTPYLPADAVRETCTQVATRCSGESRLVFDYVTRRLAEGARVGGVPRPGVALPAAVGEPLRWGTPNPVPMLYDAGFRWVRTTSFEEAALQYTGTFDRRRGFRHQALAEASGGVGSG